MSNLSKCLAVVAMSLASGCNCGQTRLDSNAPYIEVEPLVLDFGPVPVGLSASLSLDIRNLGRKSLTVQSMEIDTPEFSGPSERIVVQPGSHVVVDVTFAPSAEGERAGVAHLLSDASNDTDLTVQLNGVGTPRQACGTCTTPPQNYCANGTTLISYQTTGTCVANQCQYPASTIICGTTCDAVLRKCADTGSGGGSGGGAGGGTGGGSGGGTGGGGSSTYSWNTSSWSSCSVPCGGGTRSRSVWCEQSDGSHVSDSLCTGTAPDAMSTCNLTSCTTTQCSAMTAWQQCSSTAYVPGIHGDSTNQATCMASCGAKSAGCAKFIQYETSNVCVCHVESGLETSTFPFTQGNTSGYKIFAGNCTATSNAPTNSCPLTSTSCRTTCGTMTQGQQCNNLTYFSDKISASDTSPETCATECGKLGAGCAKYYTDGQGHDDCFCHAARGIGAATGDYVPGNSKGLTISSAECL